MQVGADTVSLLRSGAPTFHELRALIDTAHASVHVEVYEFGQTSLADALITAHRRGVAVTVIDDPSELRTAVITVRLREAGVDVADYPVRKLMIDHVKLLVVDGTVAVVGGINWGVNSPANRDYDAMVRGPVVGNLDRVFLRDLVTCGRAVAVPDPLLDPAILVASTLPATEIRPLALAVIESAHASLDLELFVLTDTGIVHALEAAQRRGVAIHVLLDPSQPSSDPSFQALRSAGVAVRLYRSHGELLHAKAIVADARAVLFGSAPRVRMPARAIRELLQLVTRDDERLHDRRCSCGNERDVCVYGRQLGADARHEGHRRRRARRVETVFAT